MKRWAQRSLVALLVLMCLSRSDAARLTPHQQLDQLLSVWDEQLRPLQPTESELASLADLHMQAEHLAEESLSVKRHGDLRHLASLQRQLEWVARLAAERIRVSRLEKDIANQREQVARTRASVDRLRVELQQRLLTDADAGVLPDASR